MEASAEAAVAGGAGGFLQSEPAHPRLRSQARFLARAIPGTVTFNRQGCLILASISGLEVILTDLQLVGIT